MKCNLKEGMDIVCYRYEKCTKAYKCKNVPKGIREKLKSKLTGTKKRMKN